MRRSTRSNPNNGLTEPSAPEEIRFAHEESPRPNYPVILQHGDTDNTDDNAGDILYRRHAAELQASDLSTDEYTPSQRGLRSPTIQRAEATSRVRGNAVSKGTPATPKDTDEEQPAKRRKSAVGPTKASENATKDTPPKLKNGGLPFNTIWYNSPFEDPEVYRMKDKAHALDTYNDLAEIIARVTEDHSRMKAALLKKGFLPESDDEDSEENVFAMD
ncbi:hypothetical protein PEX1_078950 [Penicillium expansum]|uniref:Uncharacterized protein n=1 Tax=Penicillium expansum TaxID=27334 RepID=A0A0A2J0Z8_PENEN|nr:hypothetical protein PEX2_021680 [Penicillium expansum]KGO49027.1 hypothetical protein PEXP_010760 [Penicillium expansum]KGO57725.1 hypothetical protein PEX2_021680 [Penicillium expansum]KGO63692.1 hypothetical protein PEX1_078950 [Penicillium expansum]